MKSARQAKNLADTRTAYSLNILINAHQVLKFAYFFLHKGAL